LALGLFLLTGTKPVDRLERRFGTRLQWNSVANPSVGRQTNWNILKNISEIVLYILKLIF
jgi:hypothetical protein